MEAGLAKAPADAAHAAKGKAKAAKMQRKAAKKGVGTKHGAFRCYQSPSGYQVLMGRNNKQNDELSLRIANGAFPCFIASGCSRNA